MRKLSVKVFSMLVLRTDPTGVLFVKNLFFSSQKVLLFFSLHAGKKKPTNFDFTIADGMKVMIKRGLPLFD